MSPGGWVECQDVGFLCTNSKKIDLSKSAYNQYYLTLRRAFEIAGRSLVAGPLLGQDMKAAGFVDVHEELFKWPLNPWPKDEHLKELGLWNRENLIDCLEAWALMPLSKYLGWSEDAIRELVAKAYQDLVNPKNKAYHRMWVRLSLASLRLLMLALDMLYGGGNQARAVEDP